MGNMKMKMKGGDASDIIWQGSRMIGTISMTFIIVFGLWALIAMTTGMPSPLEVIGVRRVDNCQAYMNENYVVDCKVASCPAGCVPDK